MSGEAACRAPGRPGCRRSGVPRPLSLSAALLLACTAGVRWTFTATSSAASGGRAPPRTRRGDGTPSAVAVAAPAEGKTYDVVADGLGGNGTAFALAPNVIPLTPPTEGVVKYEVPTFSPGFVLDNVLSQEACKTLKDKVDEVGVSARWGRNLGVVTFFIDEQFERELFERMKPFIPGAVGGKPIGINRRWAVIKYGPGDYMNTHIDGHVPGTMREGDELKYQPGTRSYMTCLFWLADDVVGGETVFTFPQGGTWVKIPPKTGGALLFFHGQNAVSNPYHHGGSVESGYKYLVRSDIIYG